jgi:hypothetical protein
VGHPDGVSELLGAVPAAAGMLAGTDGAGKVAVHTPVLRTLDAAT